MRPEILPKNLQEIKLNRKNLSQIGGRSFRIAKDAHKFVGDQIESQKPLANLQEIKWILKNLPQIGGR
jgi:hypothetical protein